MSNRDELWAFVLIAGIQLVVLLAVGLLTWLVVLRVIKKQVVRLMQANYNENLWEGVNAVRHFGVQWIVENELRATEGKALQKPLGTHRTFPHFDGLLFSPAQLQRPAVDPSVPIPMRTVLGERCERPLVLSMPIMVSAMGYGVGLSKKFTLALAKGTGAVGTAFNTGQGPVLPEQRQVSERMIVQVHGADWSPTDDVLAQADMIEIRFGQGANAGLESVVNTHILPAEVLRDLGVQPGASASVPVGIPGVKSASDLKRLVETLRVTGRGVPIAIKLAASHSVEDDVQTAVSAGVDIIVLDGAQGATHSSPAILVDDFGLPTLAALCRATRVLQTLHHRRKVDLIISGGIRTPGDILKALALGADAVYLGSAALFAATHTQIIKPLPFHPPTQLAWASGRYADQFDMEEGAKSLAKFLTSCSDEVALGIRALGKRAIKDLDSSDLVAWDPEVARIAAVSQI